jgi:hypothetical protein
VAHCTILYPGLLGPDVPLEELPQSEWPASHSLPNLALLLNRAQVQADTKQSFEHQLLSALGYVITADGEVPIARLRQGEGLLGDKPAWCLDPAYVQIDREIAYLAAMDELALTQSEAHQLITDINHHFADVLHIRYHSPQQWLVHTDLQLATRTPSEALLQDLSRMLPTGPDAQRWRGIVNEIQMLLHSHPLNEARQLAGKLPVNSVWLWGGGNIETRQPVIDVVYADHELVSVAASRNMIRYAALPDQIEPALFEQQNVLLVLSEQMQAIRQKDVYAWFAALNRLEQAILSPLLLLLKNRTLEYVEVQSDTLRFKLDKRSLNKWWRPRKNIASRLLELRKRYDS